MGIDDRLKKMPKNLGSQGNNGNRNFNRDHQQYNNGDFRNDNRGRYNGGYRGNGGNRPSYSSQPPTKIHGVDPAPIGEPFYNPYTFIPFPSSVARGKVSYLTADEREKERFTGVLKLKVKTLAPLMTCEALPYEGDKDTHKKYHALTIGKDVIVPATSVRGSLRTLMTILAGGTLGYMDSHMWLCQGRDLPVGPIMTDKSRPAFLAKVERPGGYAKSGLLRLGETWLISAEKLGKLGAYGQLDKMRPTTGSKQAFIDDPVRPTRISEKADGRFCYELKLSGRPVNRNGKREGVFKAGGTVVSVPAEIWETYIGRNKNGARKELKMGDLVWIEPVNPDGPVNSASDIKSIQWARWGRNGQSLWDALPECVRPDCMRKDGFVDSITDLWGQVPMDGVNGETFAARIRPHNLVFIDGSERLAKNVVLAPLAQPHPGCVPFYRCGAAESICKANAINGYKVYRNTTAHSADAPWLFSVQGIFDKNDASRMQSGEQKMNKTVDLLCESQVGELKISCRSLTKKELALLLLTCSVDWKLGGGKPFGLGHCRVIGAELVNEMGESVLNLEGSEESPLLLPEVYAELVAEFSRRVEFYKKSQEPVALLRYPRSVSSNNGGLRREGLGWFARHATLSKQGKGLETVKVGDKYFNGMVLGNIENNPGPLYAYDTIGVGERQERGNKKTFETLERFDPGKHKPVENASRQENWSQNRNTRRDDRNRRTY